MFTSRNWLLRCSIFVNLAVLLYIGAHVVVKSSPGEYSFDPGRGGRNLASAVESESQMTQAKLKGVSKPGEVSEKALPEEMRIFTFDQGKAAKVKTEGTVNAELENNRIDETKGISDGNVGDALPVVVSKTENSTIISNLDIVSNDVSVDGPGEEIPSDETSLDPGTLAKLREMLGCNDKPYEPSIRQRGEFWVLYNYVRADHGQLGCHETLTYTTHGDFTFMDNLVPLLEKWDAPVSLAIHTPGSDLASTVSTIRYFRDCVPGSSLVRKWTTFHVFFSAKHMPKQVPNVAKLLVESYNCSLPPPYVVNASSLYKTQKKLLYPVNVGRNVARDAAMTHYFLASDIELYPSPYLAARFLNMIARDPPVLHRKNPRVFPLSIFEVESNQQVPLSKTRLVEMLKEGTAIPFHKKVCSGCHNVPKSKEWLTQPETQQLDVFHIGKRVGLYIHWEPIFIGTHTDPMYDERLSWEGKSDKMTQAYAMCVLDFDFMILNNAFLVHRPGIKTLKKDVSRARQASNTNLLIRRIIFPELKVLYGTRKGCAV